MADTIITVMILIPIYGLFIWTYFNPKESMLFGKRWMYKEEPEISSKAIRFTKFVSINGMVFLTIFVLSHFLEIYFLRLLLVVPPFVVLIGAIKIFTKDND